MKSMLRQFRLFLLVTLAAQRNAILAGQNGAEHFTVDLTDCIKAILLFHEVMWQNFKEDWTTCIPKVLVVDSDRPVLIYCCEKLHSHFVSHGEVTKNCKLRHS
jgi:hypothetical protein